MPSISARSRRCAIMKRPIGLGKIYRRVHRKRRRNCSSGSRSRFSFGSPTRQNKATFRACLSGTMHADVPYTVIGENFIYKILMAFVYRLVGLPLPCLAPFFGTTQLTRTKACKYSAYRLRFPGLPVRPLLACYRTYSSRPRRISWTTQVQIKLVSAHN
eukprot:SAG31_NODE_4474_length_3203_cov_1.555412_4_plen_159_part_00